MGIADHRAGMKRHVQIAGRMGPRVNERAHMHTRRQQIGGGAVGVIGIAENRHPLAGADAPAVHIGPHRTRSHDAGAVVVAKRDGPFQRPRRQHRASGHDPPERLARRARAHRRVGCGPFQRAIGALIIGAHHTGAGQEAHIVHRRQLRRHRFGPAMPGQPAHLQRLGIQSPAGAGVLIGQNHIRPAARRCQGRHQPGRPCADHQ